MELRVRCIFYFQLEEELLRARYILSEGDAAAYLPSKSHGLYTFAFYHIFVYRKSVEVCIREKYCLT